MPQLIDTLHAFANSPAGWYLMPGAYLFYLFVALFIHRRDRREMMERSLKEGVDLEFEYSWKGIKFRIFSSVKKCSEPKHEKEKEVPPS
jgi:hypothetical protein